jgi:hypothetical protein
LKRAWGFHDSSLGAGWRYSEMIRVIRTAVLGALCGILLRLLMLSGSEANHPSGWVDTDGDGILEHKHLLSITNYLPERYCVYKSAGNLSELAYYQRVRTSLELGPSETHWNRLGNIGQLTVDISGSRTGLVCPDYNIWVSITNNAPCTGDASCARLHSWANNTTTGHREATGARVYLRPWHIEDDGFYRHVVSHEFGHVFGLADGGGPCPESVMHDKYYGCSVNLHYPSDLDRASVYGLIPKAHGGGGGGGRGCPFALPC